MDAAAVAGQLDRVPGQQQPDLVGGAGGEGEAFAGGGHGDSAGLVVLVDDGLVFGDRDRAAQRTQRRHMGQVPGRRGVGPHLLQVRARVDVQGEFGEPGDEQVPVVAAGALQVGAEQLVAAGGIGQGLDPGDAGTAGDAEGQVQRHPLAGADTGGGVPEPARDMHDVAGGHGAGPQDFLRRVQVVLGVAVHRVRARGSPHFPGLLSGQLHAQHVVVVPMG
ncbi:MAG: hypothetical protein AUG49_20355 [Catenulispora sp. 13_1_20CM_3_70_7]|nr:MAG: hypothetical protein AUG49_20355 [Catenulispora sp. 13_1_20CM_3_70_7]